jgi:C1A family cysteine protease
LSIFGIKEDFNPAYLQYLDDYEAGDIEKYGGLVPDPHLAKVPLPTETVQFPAMFDPRATYMTPVKVQSDCDVCWAFATMGALESLVSLISGEKKQLFRTTPAFIP